MARKKSGCLSKVFKFFLILVVIGTIANIGKDSDNTGSKSNNAINPTISSTARTTAIPATKKPTPKITATPKPSAIPTVPKPTEESRLEILLKYPELGEYGQYYTFNENVAKATAEDKNTIIQCFIPAGRYILKSEGNYPAFVFIYSKQTQINSSGWEEAVDCWSSGMLQPGDTCEITINENYYIKLFQNNVFRLVQIEKFETESTVIPTEHPTSQPTPNPTYVPLKQGSEGEAVLKMKLRLYELGYFTTDVLSEIYNGTTAERVELFQKINGLPQTGKADSETLELLFSDKAKETDIYRPTPKPTNKPTATPAPKNQAERTYILNKNTKKFHYPSCSSAKQIKEKNKGTFTGTREEVIKNGYDPCGKCNP